MPLTQVRGVRHLGRVHPLQNLRLEWHGVVFLSLQQRSKQPREMVIAPKASNSTFSELLPHSQVRGARHLG